jgi:hypothetical protein
MCVFRSRVFTPKGLRNLALWAVVVVGVYYGLGACDVGLSWG